MLSKNYKYDEVVNKIVENIITDNNINTTSKDELINIGSEKTPLYEVYTETRRGNIRIVIGVIDIYYKSK